MKDVTIIKASKSITFEDPLSDLVFGSPDLVCPTE